jgi:hypothetical protein
MKPWSVAVMVLGVTVAAAAGGVDRFAYATAEELRANWILGQTGAGQARWSLAEVPDAPSRPGVLRQAGGADYPVALNRKARLPDGAVEVRFKAVAGQKDQAGGVVWRARDEQNYYICRANALENNVVLYKVEGGKRRALDIVGRTGGYGVDTPVALGSWHTLRVEFAGPLFRVWFNGKELFAVRDETFQEAGMAGLWTKADSETLFDDFTAGEP